MHSFSALFFPILLATSVLAHGHVAKITIAGKVFNGNNPGAATAKSVIRQISSPDPNHGADNVAIICGPNSSPGSDIADANPGDEVTFDWKGGDLGFWPHNIGPMFTYMASCGNITCDKFNITKAKWFKTQQVGRKLDSASGTWEQDDLMQGGVAITQIPSTLAPGNYLIRHEIIALHLADQGPKLAEFYPSCSQLRVGGNQTGVPQESDLVSFPGAYKDSDPGLDDKDVFNINVKYIYPGPPVATLLNGTSTATSTGSSTGLSTIASSTISSATAADTTVTVFTTTTLATSAIPTNTAGRIKTVIVTVTASTNAAASSSTSSSAAPSQSPIVNNIAKRHSRMAFNRGMRVVNHL